MAEGLVGHFLAAEWEAHSAGTKPAGHVHELAVAVMSELGIDISRQRSKSVEEVLHWDFDLVITVCDDAAETCPTWLRRGPMLHVGFPDPARVTGSRQQRLAACRRIRDKMRERLLEVLVNHPHGSGAGREES